MMKRDCGGQKTGDYGLYTLKMQFSKAASIFWGLFAQRSIFFLWFLEAAQNAIAFLSGGLFSSIPSQGLQ